MASKSGVVKANQEIVPSSDLPKFQDALATMDDLEAQLEPIAKEAREIKVTDAVSYARAGVLIATLKSAVKTGDGTMSPYDAILKKVKDFIQTRKLRIKNRVEEVTGILTPKMADYDRKEKQAAADEQQRVARETKQRLDREAEEKRRADEESAKELRKQKVDEIRADLKAGVIGKREAEKRLRAAGATEEAAKAQAAAEEEEGKQAATKKAEGVKVQSNVPAVAGVVRRTNYYAQCIDQDAFLRAFARECAKTGDLGPMRQFIQVSDQLLCAKARDVKDSTEMAKMFPAIKAWDEKSY